MASWTDVRVRLNRKIAINQGQKSLSILPPPKNKRNDIYDEPSRPHLFLIPRLSRWLRKNPSLKTKRKFSE